MNKVDCIVLEVADKTFLTKGQMDWVKDNWTIYKVKAVSHGHEFYTTIWVKWDEDEGQIKKGYVFQE